MTYTEKTEALLLEYGLYNDKMCDELAALTHQAIAEERARVRGIVKEMLSQSGYEDGDRIDRTDLLSSLDTTIKEKNPTTLR